jgi:hypothetical protein
VTYRRETRAPSIPQSVILQINKLWMNSPKKQSGVALLLKRLRY